MRKVLQDFDSQGRTLDCLITKLVRGNQGLRPSASKDWGNFSCSTAFFRIIGVFNSDDLGTEKLGKIRTFLQSDGIKHNVVPYNATNNPAVPKEFSNSYDTMLSTFIKNMRE